MKKLIFFFLMSFFLMATSAFAGPSLRLDSDINLNVSDANMYLWRETSAPYAQISLRFVLTADGFKKLDEFTASPTDATEPTIEFRFALRGPSEAIPSRLILPKGQYSVECRMAQGKSQLGEKNYAAVSYTILAEDLTHQSSVLDQNNHPWPTTFKGFAFVFTNVNVPAEESDCQTIMDSVLKAVVLSN